MEEIKTELRQDSTFIKANAVEKLAYVSLIKLFENLALQIAVANARL